jgi:hypothetical protein
MPWIHSLSRIQMHGRVITALAESPPAAASVCQWDLTVAPLFAGKLSCLLRICQWACMYVCMFVCIIMIMMMYVCMYVCISWYPFAKYASCINMHWHLPGTGMMLYTIAYLFIFLPVHIKFNLTLKFKIWPRFTGRCQCILWSWSGVYHMQIPACFMHVSVDDSWVTVILAFDWDLE